MRFKLLFLGLIITGAMLAASQARAAGLGLTCLPPTPLEPIVNKLTGEVILWWQPAMAVQRYFIEVYSDTSKTPLKTYTVEGSHTTFTIPNEDLNCGNYKYRLKAECCFERCDACTSQFDPKKNYCSNMADLWEKPCACPDPNSPTRVPYSFHFACSGGSYAGWVCSGGSLPVGGVCADGSTPLYFYNCPPDQKIVGCSWECSSMTHYEPKLCGSDFEIKCGKGPHQQLVSSQPFFDLCAFKDAIGWSFSDYFLIRPPGVVANLTPPLKYTWNCVTKFNEIGEQCFSCRRAECGEPQGKFYKDALPTEKLCVGADGLPTGEVANLMETSEGWTWDCVGTPECGTNKNWVKVWNGETKDMTPNTWKSIEKCSASRPSCGAADSKFYTNNNFSSKASEAGFLCPANSTAHSYFWDAGNKKSYDQDTSALRGVDGSIVTQDRRYWMCVFNDGTPDESFVNCEAHIVGCRDAVRNANYTQGSFDTITNAYDAPANFCRNGRDAIATSAEVQLIGPDPTDTPVGWSWICADLYGGEESCSAKLVACKEPPHKGEFASADEIKPPLCTAGTASALFEVLNGATLTGWHWWCEDDFKSTVDCDATKLVCQEPPSGGVFDDWTAFIKTPGVKCNDTANPNIKSCTAGVCSSNSKPVNVTKANNKWIWTCGTDPCEATQNVCNKPFAEGAYADWDEFIKELIDKEGGDCGLIIDDKSTCSGVCADKEKDAVVSYANGQFTWTCGAEKCATSPMGCGTALAASPWLYTDFEKYQKDPYGSEAQGYMPICLGKGFTVKWYNGYGSVPDGFTSWGIGEFSNPFGLAFQDHDTKNSKYKEGSWLWRCDYNGKTVPNRGAANTYEKDGVAYCYAWDKGVCNKEVIVGQGNFEGQNNNKFTLNEIKRMAADSPQKRGNIPDPSNPEKYPQLCTRGIVYNGFNGSVVNSKTLDPSPFSCGATNQSDPNISYDHCAYWCEHGMLKGVDNTDNCDIDVAACAKPPYGNTYNSQADFDKDWNATGGCEKKGDYYKFLKFDEDKCQWTWECDDNGYFGCYANKAKLALTATIKPDVLPDACTSNTDPRTLEAITNCQKDKAEITWLVDGQQVATGFNYNFTAKSLYEKFGKEGTYNITYRLHCNEKCINGSPDITAKAVPFTITKSITPTITIEPDEISCTAKPTTYTANIKNCAADKRFVQWSVVKKNDPNIPPFNRNGSGESFAPTADFSTGEYTLTFTLTCNEDCRELTTITSKDITIQQSKDVSVSVSGQTEYCSDQNLFFTAAGSVVPSCEGKLSYRWFINPTPLNQGEVFDADTDNDPATLNVPTPYKYQEGNHTVKVEFTCADKCAKPKPVAATLGFSIIPKKTPQWNAAIEGAAGFCSDKPPFYSIDLNKIVDCDDYTIIWSLKDKDGKEVNSAPDSGGGIYQMPENLSAGDYVLQAILVCNQDCRDKTPIVKSKDITVEKTFEDPSGVNIAPANAEICQQDPPEHIFNASVFFDPNNPLDDCTDVAYTWLVEDEFYNKKAEGSGQNFTLNTSGWAEGLYMISVEAKCQSECSEQTSVSKSELFTIFNCSCGTASNKNFVDIGYRGTPEQYALCNKNGVAISDPPQLTGLKWNWDCKYGSKTITGCSADKVECGINKDKKLITTTWDTINSGFCTAGSKVNYRKLNLVNEVTNSNYYKIDDTVKWDCQDSVNSTTTCSGLIVDCGIADANRVLEHNAPDNKIKPLLNGNYRGSYSGPPDTGHYCVNDIDRSILNDGERGKWVWQCQDDNNTKLDCEARNDCGWADSSATITTVDYNDTGNAGCWTAENVGANNLTWPTALNLNWNSCGYNHCWTTTRNPVTGLCPSGYVVPKDSDWHKLENNLANGNSCDADRFNQWACAPAGADNQTGWENDGLKDQITFAGNANGYWTSKTSWTGSPLCGFNKCGNNRNECDKSLYLFQLQSSGNAVNRNGDTGNCSISTLTSHQLRCISGASNTPSKPPDCTGFGCYPLGL